MRTLTREEGEHLAERVRALENALWDRVVTVQWFGATLLGFQCALCGAITTYSHSKTLEHKAHCILWSAPRLDLAEARKALSQQVATIEAVQQ